MCVCVYGGENLLCTYRSKKAEAVETEKIVKKQHLRFDETLDGNDDVELPEEAVKMLAEKELEKITKDLQQRANEDNAKGLKRKRRRKRRDTETG